MALSRPPGPAAPAAAAPAPRRAPAAKTDTREFRRWEGVNVRDSRTAIGDTEFSWLQNFIPIGNATLEMVRAPAPPVGEYGPGLGRMWGFNLHGFDVIVAVGLDGSLQQFTTSGERTQIAPPGSVTIMVWATLWMDSAILFIDEAHGYSSWNGGEYTVIDATIKGKSIAVFEGRVWIGNKRVITWSAPNSHTTFDLELGAGAAAITDNAFRGDIVTLVSALQQLWVIGESAINAISNVQAFGQPPVVLTSFSNTNILSSLGCPSPSAVITYFRALVFGSPYGVYALSGVTPQKLSEKLDGLSHEVEGMPPYFDGPTALATLEDSLVHISLTAYKGVKLHGAPRGLCPVPMLLCFTQGKWFFATQGWKLKWITTLYARGGAAQAWGHDGTHLYQLFAGDFCTPLPYKIEGKLYDFGSAVTEKTLMKLGVEMRASVPESCGCDDIILIDACAEKEGVVSLLASADILLDHMVLPGGIVKVDNGHLLASADLSVDAVVVTGTALAAVFANIEGFASIMVDEMIRPGIEPGQFTLECFAAMAVEVT